MITNEEILDHCLNVVSDVTKLRKNRILTKKRTRELVEPRYLLFYMLSYRYKISLTDIARMTKFHHATVVHGKKVIKNLADSKLKYSMWIDNVMMDEVKIDTTLRDSIHNILIKGYTTPIKVDRIIKAVREYEENNKPNDDSVSVEGSQDSEGSKEDPEELEGSQSYYSDDGEYVGRIKQQYVFNK